MVRPEYKPQIYFETSVLLIAFIILGRYLENKAKSRTSDVPPFFDGFPLLRPFCFLSLLIWSLTYSFCHSFLPSTLFDTSNTGSSDVTPSLPSPSLPFTYLLFLLSYSIIQ